MLLFLKIKKKLNFYHFKGEKLITYVQSSIDAYLQQVDGNVLVKKLTEAQKLVFYWSIIDYQITNGGFYQLYSNGLHVHLPSLINGLLLIGDKDKAFFFKKVKKEIDSNFKFKEKVYTHWEEVEEKFFAQKFPKKLEDFLNDMQT